MIEKKGNSVTWDTYGIRNNPTYTALERELKRLESVQENQLKMNVSVDNGSMTQRQYKINVVKKRLGETK